MDSASDNVGDRQSRRARVKAIADEFAGIYPPDFFDDLRREWPE